MFDWPNNHRVEDLTVSPNGRWLVAMDDRQHIQVYNLVTRDLEYEMDLNIRLMSVSISQDSRHLLVNHQNGVAQLIDLFTREPVQSYSGHNGGEEFVIRSAFGGADESFVASGSEGKAFPADHLPAVADNAYRWIYTHMAQSQRPTRGKAEWALS